MFVIVKNPLDESKLKLVFFIRNWIISPKERQKGHFQTINKWICPYGPSGHTVLRNHNKNIEKKFHHNLKIMMKLRKKEIWYEDVKKSNVIKKILYKEKTF